MNCIALFCVHPICFAWMVVGYMLLWTPPLYHDSLHNLSPHCKLIVIITF